MIERWIDISCNTCGAQLSDTHGMDLSQKRVIKWAKKDGWEIESSKQTYCPKCKFERYLDILYELTQIEQAGELTEKPRAKYIKLVNLLKKAKVDIPFGIII